MAGTPLAVQCEEEAVAASRRRTRIFEGDYMRPAANWYRCLDIGTSSMLVSPQQSAWGRSKPHISCVRSHLCREGTGCARVHRRRLCAFAPSSALSRRVPLRRRRMRVDSARAWLRFVRPAAATTANVNANLSDSPPSMADPRFASRRIAGLIPLSTRGETLFAPTNEDHSCRVFARARRPNINAAINCAAWPPWAAAMHHYSTEPMQYRPS